MQGWERREDHVEENQRDGGGGNRCWLFKANEHLHVKASFLQTQNGGKEDTLEGKGRPSGLPSRWCAELGFFLPSPGRG